MIKNNMKVAIVTCFESNEERCNYLNSFFKEKNYEVDVFTTNFSHIDKQKRNNIPNGFIPIETKAYSSNLSFARIMSHINFAKDVFKKIREKTYDLIYVIAPANSLIKEAKQYKKDFPDTKIIIDIIDMWPESLPLKLNKNIFPFNIWRNIRKNNIDVSDYLVCECDLYREILEKEYTKRIKTIYLCKDNDVKINKQLDDEKLTLLYIGSINNIIDIDKIYHIIKNTNYPVKLHVIGEGENSKYFIEKLSSICELEYHGSIYDNDRKNEIFNKCHAGINIYKDNLYIGLTTKCLDYFMYGLPIINNIKGDTYKLLNDYDAGINVGDDLKIDVDKIIDKAHDYDNIIKMYENNFSISKFNENLAELIDEAMK